jgi:hypothetical protein
MINMSNGPDPFDRLREGFQSPTPGPQERDRAWGYLQEAFSADELLTRRRSKWRRAPVAVLALGLLSIGILALSQSNPARASLFEIAQASRRATPIEVPAGSFLYVRSAHVDLALRPGAEFGLDRDYVAYLVPTNRESWSSSDPGFVHLRIEVGQPQFFTQEVELAYYTNGLNALDSVGETIVERFSGVNDPIAAVEWPTDVEQLRDAMEEYVSEQGDGRPLEARLLDLAVDLLRARNPSPAFRAAILEVLAELPLDLTEVEKSGTANFAMSYRTPLLTRDEVRVSPNGHLVSETSRFLEADAEVGVPAGTVVLAATYDRLRVVDGAPR